MPPRRGRTRHNGHGGRVGDVPQAWLGGWFDPELEDLFRQDPALQRTAHMVRSARPEADPDPDFRSRLRRSLMAEAQRTGAARRRRWFFGPTHLAWGGVGVGLAAAAATVLALFTGQQPDHLTVEALSNVSAQHSVSPNDVITVSFNQPMDQAAVVAGLHVQPATNVETAWRGNDLLITPVHHLAGNTPYTVTIDRAHARTAGGTVARAAIQISFGTAPSSTRTITPEPPGLTIQNVGAIAADASVLFARDGSLVVTSAAPPAGTDSTPQASAGAGAGATPSLSASASPGAASASATDTVAYPASGAAPVVLGASASAAAFSPEGEVLAMAVPQPAGGSALVLTSATGTTSSTLTRSTSEITSLAWSTNQSIVFATSSGTIRSVDLTGVSRTLSEQTSAASIQLSPGARYAYLAPQSGSLGGQLLTIGSAKLETLAGSATGVAFSADDSTVAWIDQSGPRSLLRSESPGTGAPVAVAPLDLGASLSGVALNPNGSQVAYVERTAGGAPETVVAQLPSGAAVATGPGASALAFSPDGRSLALAGTGGAALRAPIPGAAQLIAGGLPGAARTALQAFVDAQVSGDTSVLTSLSTDAAGAAAGTPSGLTRGYVVSAAANPDGTVTANAELIVDPTAAHPEPSKLDETLTLGRGPDGTSYLITSLVTDGLHDESPGPHVLGVSTAVEHGVVVVRVTFDSDLDQTTIPGSIRVALTAGGAIDAPVTYNADTRTATVRLDGSPGGPISVLVAQTLRDVDGQVLASAFTTRVSL